MHGILLVSNVETTTKCYHNMNLRLFRALF